MSLESRKSEMFDVAAQISPVAALLVQAVEKVLLGLVADPNAKALLTTAIAYLNSLLGIGATSVAAAANDMHTAAIGGGVLIKALIAALEKMLAGLSGNPAVLQTIIAFIESLLGGLQPTPAA